MSDIKKHTWTTTKLILFGYLVVISTGTALLMLPISNKQHIVTPVIDALFTATSATCVTGLVVHDTYTFWSAFGQGVILLLIQIGGIGFMTIAIWALTLTKRKIGLSQRLLMQEAVAAPQVGGIVRMTKFVFFSTLIIEGTGAVLLSFYFIPKLGILKGTYFSVFHAISAFCNAGIDLMGYFEPSSSLTTVSGNPLISMTIASLIIIGGLGFLVWADIIKHGIHVKRYRLHSKIVLMTTFLLILGGTILIFIFEWGKPSMEGRSLGEQILCSFFQATTPRTAGFNSVDLTTMTGCSKVLMTGLMFIGGSPGSTAGGIKTTTMFVMVLSIWTEFRKRKDIECFRRRVESDVVRHASCVTMMYGFLIITASLFISHMDNVGIQDVIYETTSAIGTVGLTLNLTTRLSDISHLVLILLMFIGRVGGISFLIAFGNRISSIPSKLPTEKVTVG